MTQAPSIPLAFLYNKISLEPSISIERSQSYTMSKIGAKIPFLRVKIVYKV